MPRQLIYDVFFVLGTLRGVVETTAASYLLPFNVTTYNDGYGEHMGLLATIAVGTPPQSFVFRIQLFESTTYVKDHTLQEGNCCPSICDNPGRLLGEAYVAAV